MDALATSQTSFLIKPEPSFRNSRNSHRQEPGAWELTLTLTGAY